MAKLSVIGEVTAYTELVQARLYAIKAREIPLAHARVLNRCATTSRAEVSRGIASALKLPQRKVRGRLFIRKASRDKLVASIRVYHRGIPAIQLPGVRDKGRYRTGIRGRRGTGVSARGGYQYPGSWIAKAPHGGQQVFERQGKKARPIDVIRIEVKDEAKNRTPKITQRVMREEYPKRMLAELEHRFNKYRAK